jgi:ketosteroid isomerase-like protein
MSSRPPSRSERFRQVIGEWNQRGIEAIEKRWHDDIVWEEPSDWPDAGTHQGREAVFKRMRERFAFLGVVAFDIVDVEEVGDRLFVDVIVRGRGATSGAPAEMHSFWIYEYADDERVIRWREFNDRDEALAALREDEPSP